MDKFHISEPLHLCTRYSANLPTTRKIILSYYERLLNAGLAMKISLHTTKEEYLCDAITTSPEVTEVILRCMPAMKR